MMSPLRLITDSVRALLDGHDAFGAAHAGAHEASTSPWNVLRPPTREQQRAGNYPLGTVAWKGLTLRIENPAHTVREGVGEDGKPWRSLVKANYGYVAGTRGSDGDGVDVFLGPFPESDRVWVLNQRDAAGNHDEHKILAGFVDVKQAVDAYRLSYTPGWDRYGPPIPLSLKQLRWWLQYADLTRELTLDLVPPEPEDMNDTTDTIAATFDAAEDAFSPFYAQVSKETGLSVYELQDISDRGRMNWAGGARSALRDAEKRFSVAEGQAKKKGLTQDMKALFLREVDLSTRLIEKAKINLKASEMLLALAKGPKLDAVAPTLSRVFWDSAAEPMSGKTLGDVLYDIRASDGIDGLVMDAMTMGDITEGAELIMLDALVTLAGKLKPKMEVLMRVMEAAGGEVKPLALQLSEPMRRHGGVHVAALFELSDGQTITIWFHNPDSTPSKLTPADDLVSWKWQLNKKDITIVVAPESGQDLNLREVARRIMRLAAKNSPAFAKANGKRSAVMAEITGLRATLGERRDTLQGLMGQIEVAKVEADDRVAKKAAGPALPFLMTKDGKVTIFDGDTAQPLPDDWTGICVDGAKGVKDFWYIGRSGGERSFTKMRADNLTDATIEARGVMARESAEKAAEDLRFNWQGWEQLVLSQLEAEGQTRAEAVAAFNADRAKMEGLFAAGWEPETVVSSVFGAKPEPVVKHEPVPTVPSVFKDMATEALELLTTNPTAHAAAAEVEQEVVKNGGEVFWVATSTEPEAPVFDAASMVFDAAAGDLSAKILAPKFATSLASSPKKFGLDKIITISAGRGGERTAPFKLDADGIKLMRNVIASALTKGDMRAMVDMQPALKALSEADIQAVFQRVRSALGFTVKLDSLFELDGARFVRGDITYKGRAMGSVTVSGVGKAFFIKPDGAAFSGWPEGAASDAAADGLLGWTDKIGPMVQSMFERAITDDEIAAEVNRPESKADDDEQDGVSWPNTILDKSNPHWKVTLNDSENTAGTGKTKRIGILRKGSQELIASAVYRGKNAAAWYIVLAKPAQRKMLENIPFPTISGIYSMGKVAAILMGYLDADEASGFKIAPPGVSGSDLAMLYISWADEVVRTVAEAGMTEPEASAMYKTRDAEMKALWESGQGAAGAALKLLEGRKIAELTLKTAPFIAFHIDGFKKFTVVIKNDPSYGEKDARSDAISVTKTEFGGGATRVKESAIPLAAVPEGAWQGKGADWAWFMNGYLGEAAPSPEPAPTETAEAKFLREVGAGVHDALDLGDMLVKIEASITAMKEADQLAGDNDPVADAAILHWAALEEKANG